MSHKKLRGFKEKNCAYVDGSFNPKNDMYGAGVVMISPSGHRTTHRYRGSEPDWAKMRNVAGEILGAMKAIELAFKTGMLVLTIYHDYEGIGAWPEGRWRCNNPITQQYADYVNQMIANGMKITFHHVKGHSGVRENELADRLAREAVGLS